MYLDVLHKVNTQAQDHICLRVPLQILYVKLLISIKSGLIFIESC